MENIQIGEYVRTKNGYILRNTIKEHKYIIDNFKEYKNKFGEIVKNSNSLIDLIEVGDYINGEKILEIILPDEKNVTKETEEEVITVCIFKNGNGTYYKYISEAKIENMLTRERYEENCYKS